LIAVFMNRRMNDTARAETSTVLHLTVMRPMALVLLFGLSVCGGARAQGARPLTGWKSRPADGTDTTAQLREAATGWHVATTQAGIWWDPTMVEQKSFNVLLDAVLLPDGANNGFGVFVGGRNLEGDQPEYLSFQIKGDGTYLVELRHGEEVHALAPWMSHRAITRALSGTPTNYSLRLEVHPLRLDFVVNGLKVHSIDRATVRADGNVGLRFDAGLSMDLTRFRVDPAR
jgi:hypothetical protein